MQKRFALGLLLAFSWMGALAQDAQAGVTLDVLFHEGPGGGQLTIATGSSWGSGCSFGGYYGGSVTTGFGMDVILKTTDPLIWVNAYVAYDSDNGLAVGSFYEWKAVGLSFNKAGDVVKSCEILDGVSDDGGKVGSFDCGVAPPNAPPSLAPGTYRIGTIVWDASVLGGGLDFLERIEVPLPVVGAVINGLVTDVSDTVVLGSATVYIIGIPEPGTAALLGLGFVGLTLAARKRRGRS